MNATITEFAGQIRASYERSEESQPRTKRNSARAISRQAANKVMQAVMLIGLVCSSPY